MPNNAGLMAGFGAGGIGKNQIGSSAAQAGTAGQPGVIVVTEFLRRT
jgi:hypothetical protein